MRKINWGGCMDAVVLTFILAILGCLAGCLVDGEINVGNWQWWQPLGKPGAGAIKFLKMEPNSNNQTETPYVEDAIGNVFRRSTLTNGQWEQVSSPTDKGGTGCDYFPYPVSKQPIFSNLPSQVMDCERMQWGWEWVTTSDFIVILADGSVWKWYYHSGIDQLFNLVCGGSIIASVIGWATILFVRKKQASRASPDESLRQPQKQL